MKKFLGCVCFLLLLLVFMWGMVVQPVFFVEQKTAPSVDAAMLEQHVRMFSQTLHPRCFDHPEYLDAAVTYIGKHFTAAGGRVHIQPFPAEEREYSNVIASFGPQEGPVLIIGAHYDSYGELDSPTPMYTPGADDNASGVAGLLALAELFQKYPPARPVQLVAYCLEEPPFFGTDLMGSAFHAKQVHQEGRAVVGMISIEMIGYFSDVPGSQTYPVQGLERLYPDTGNFIGVVGRVQDTGLTRRVKAAMRGASDLPVVSINAVPLLEGISFSDHRNYWPLGYEAVMVTDTAFFRNFEYHTELETANRLDYGRMSKVVQGLFVAAMTLTETAW